MPYADYFHSYWTGYYTSLPTQKHYGRVANHQWLRVSSQLLSLSPFGTAESGLWTEIDSLSRSIALFQHHDAITGTDRTDVAADFMTRLSVGIQQSQNAMEFIVQNLIGTNNTFEYCMLSNESKCDATNGLGTSLHAVAIVLHNSLSWDIDQYVNIPIPIQNATVIDAFGNQISAQISEAFVFPPKSESDVLPFVITFSAKVPALGFAVYVISDTPSSETVMSQVSSNFSNGMGNGILQVEFKNGLLSKISNLNDGIFSEISQNLMYYTPSLGQDEPSVQASGAYIFRPNNSNLNPIGPGNPGISYISGPIFQQVLQTWTSWACQSVRLYHDKDYLEITHYIGPIQVDTDSFIGKEVVTVFDTDIDTNKTFYSDSQGMHFIKRVYNERSWPNYKVFEPISGNYYPSSIGAYIVDEGNDIQMTMLNDQSRGTASVENGRLEFMLHRRLLIDDNRGLYQPLDDDSPLISTSRLFLTRKMTAAKSFRPNALILNRPFVPMFSGLESVNQWENLTRVFSPLKLQALPENVVILNLDIVEGDQVLLRLQHIYDEGEDRILSQPAVVNLLQIFANKSISFFEETTLTTTTPLPVGSPKVTLNPMEIRTFLIAFKHTS